jgi:CheY-like chemotaxis protein
LRFLLVEDEMMVAFLVESLVRDLGHEIVATESRLDKAVALAQHETLDCAILDVNIAGREVYPVADALRARGVPFIFATGYGSARLPETHRQVPTLQKPYQAEDLRAAIAQALRRTRV